MALGPIKSLIEQIVIFAFLFYLNNLYYNLIFVNKLNKNTLLITEYKSLAIYYSTNTYLGLFCSTRCKDESGP